MYEHLNRVVQTAAIAACLTAATCMALVTNVSAEPIKLKLSWFADAQSPTYVTGVKPFIDSVNKEGAGIVQIEAFPNGALGRSLPAQPQMVLDGVADIAFVVTTLTPARFPDNAVLELPGLFRDVEESTLVHTRLVQKEKLRGYSEFFVVGAFGTPPYSLHSRKAINSLKDIAGMRFTTSSGTASESLRALGAVPVTMPISEVVEAIGRGTVDGTMMHVGAFVEFGMPRVTKTDYLISLGAQHLALIMNRQKFTSLSPEAKAIILKFSGEWLAKQYGENYGAYVRKSEHELNADPKRTFVVPTAEDAAQAAKVTQPIVDAWLAKDPRNPELLSAVRAEIANIRR